MKFQKSYSLFIIVLIGFGTMVVLNSGKASNVNEDKKIYFAGGNGTENDPYLISNVTQLQNMSNDLDAHYELSNDIDASNTTKWNGKAGFKPVGNSSNKFNGSLDGQGYSITGLYINRSGTYQVGLFGYLNESVTVENLLLKNANISGNSVVGGLVGFNEGIVNNSSTIVNITGNGLVAKNNGVINNSYATGNISGNGLVGRNSGVINNSYATGNINGDGGLVNNNFGTIRNSYTAANINGRGGLVGENEGLIVNCSAYGNVSGYSNVGGLVGNSYQGKIKRCSATGDVSGDYQVGGLVGDNEDTPIIRCSASGDVTGSSSNIGGLVGYNRYSNAGRIINSYASGNVSGGETIGGLVGYNWGKIRKCYATGKVNGTNLVGGLIGDNHDTITDSFWDVNQTNQSSSDGGTGKSTAEMKDIDTFTNESTQGLSNAWDFLQTPNDDDCKDDIWYMDSQENINDGYPILKINLGWDDISPLAIAGSNRTVKQGEEFTLNGSNSSDNVGIDNYEWNLDNGVTKMGEVITYSYKNAGNYTVELNATDYGKNSDTDTVKIEVKMDTTPPETDAGPDKTIANNSVVTLNASDSSDNVGITSFTWTIKGVEYTGEVVQYKFTEIGTFEVRLNATDVAGNFETDTAMINVTDVTSPKADAGPDRTVDEDTVVTFNGSGSSDNVEIENYTWTISGKKYYGKIVNHTFTDPKTDSAELTVTDHAGNSDTDIASIKVEDVTPPQAEAGLNRTVDEDTVITFDGSRSSDNGWIAIYTWTIEGTEYQGECINHTFEDPGDYIVELNVTDTGGNYDIDIANLSVKDITPPEADAGENKSVTAGEEFILNGSNSSDNGEITDHSDYVWDLDNGDTRYGKKISYTYDIPGKYVIELTVIDGAQNIDSDIVSIDVKKNTSVPVITSVSTSDINDTSATVTWMTREPCDSMVNYSINPDFYPIFTKFKDNMVLNHSVTLLNLSPNTTYYFEVFSTDESGYQTRDNNYGNYYSFTTMNLIDTDPPIFSIDTPAKGTNISNTSVSVRWNGSDSDSGLSHYEIRLDEGNWTDVGNSTEHVFSGLLDDAYTVSVRAIDDANNTALDSVSFTVDTTSPTISISSPEGGAVIGDPSVNVEWNGGDEHSSTQSYQVMIDDGEWREVGTNTSYTWEDLSTGEHTVTVKAVDMAGNENTTTVEFEVEESSTALDAAADYWWAIALVVIVIIVGLGFFYLKKVEKQ